MKLAKEFLKTQANLNIKDWDLPLNLLSANKIAELMDEYADAKKYVDEHKKEIPLEDVEVDDVIVFLKVINTKLKKISPNKPYKILSSQSCQDYRNKRRTWFSFINEWNEVKYFRSDVTGYDIKAFRYKY